MSGQTKPTIGGETLAVSTPGGGLACHFRVQYHSISEADWRMHGTFRTLQQAEQCLDDLRRHGLQARLVRYNIVPAAA